MQLFCCCCKLYFIFVLVKDCWPLGWQPYTAVHLVTDRVQTKMIHSRSISCHAQGSSPVQTALASLPPRSVVHELPGSCSGLPLPWHVRRGWLAPQRVGWWASAGAWGTAREGTVHCCRLQAHHASSSLPKRSPSPQHTPACCLAQCPSPVRCACGPDISSIREQPCCRFTAVRRNSRELVTKITIFKILLFLFFFRCL